MVVNEPKRMTIDGVGIGVKDSLKFVNATSDGSDSDCNDLPAQGQTGKQPLVSADLTVWLPFDSGSNGELGHYATSSTTSRTGCTLP